MTVTNRSMVADGHGTGAVAESLHLCLHVLARERKLRNSVSF